MKNGINTLDDGESPMAQPRIDLPKSVDNNTGKKPSTLLMSFQNQQPH